MLEFNQKIKDALIFFKNLDIEFYTTYLNQEAYFTLLGTNYSIEKYDNSIVIYDCEAVQNIKSIYILQRCYACCTYKNIQNNKIWLYINNYCIFKDNSGWNYEEYSFNSEDEYFNLLLLLDIECSLSYDDFKFLEELYKDFKYDMEVYL